ncbi:MAG: MBL fold metallo-hydrolase [Pseudanabaenaceae cyanobacterium]
MRITWLDSNSWLIDWQGSRWLIDPWLVGILTFGDTPWLFRQVRKQERPLPENIDVVLLSQGLPDHAHPPTLKALYERSPELQVICSRNALPVVAPVGFRQVIPLDHGQEITVQNRFQIRATVGAPIGPFSRENGYIVKDLQTNISFYYEPHGYPDPQLAEFAPVTIGIAPVINLKIPFVGSLINGKDSAPQMAEALQIRYILPTAMGGDLEFGGLLLKFLQVEGSIAELKQRTRAQVLEPQPWVEMTISTECVSGHPE